MDRAVCIYCKKIDCLYKNNTLACWRLCQINKYNKNIEEYGGSNNYEKQVIDKIKYDYIYKD